VKHAIIICILFSMLIIVSACTSNISNDTILDDFVKLEKYSDDTGYGYLCYNKDTYMMYYILVGSHRSGISPCYIFDDDTNECHVGHYPEDWNE